MGLEDFWGVPSHYRCHSRSFSATFFSLKIQMKILAFSTADSRTGRPRSRFFPHWGLNGESFPPQRNRGAHSHPLSWLCGHDSARDLLPVRLLGLMARNAPPDPGQQQRSLYYQAPCSSLPKPSCTSTLPGTASVHHPWRYGTVWKWRATPSPV